MKISIRQEIPSDYSAVADAVRAAYKDVPYSNHREQFMVERLRTSNAFIPALSLVAEVNHEIVGHILLTRIFIHNLKTSLVSLALAPLSVVPAFQGKGIGSHLVSEAHRIAKELGYSSVTVLGPANYYPRFGYEPMKKYGLQLPFFVREENCMILGLTEKALSGVTGKVKYAPEFVERPEP